ncbi:hypothetical protein LCGC14_1377170 [marine sediment metagenome]|uniref:Uncharacterized protein n=1 Tax=marine sediment metagenome TaxID=412755 RepID=A0A0F9KPN4_9ZZZZ
MDFRRDHPLGNSPMTSEEARTKLEAWRDLLKAKLEGVHSGPWRVDPDDRPKMEWNDQIIRPGGIRNDGLTVCFMSNDEWDGDHGQKPDSNFIAFSRSAVPAMLAGIQVALKEHEKISSIERADELTKYGEGSFAQSCQLLMATARAYEPYFQEVQG